MTDDEQITALFDRMSAAWTAGDARAYGECFTTDCDYVSYDGNRAQGREPVITSHDKLFRGVLHGSALIGRIDSIRHLRDGVALVHSTGSVLTAWRKTLPKRRLTRNTIVAVRDADGWRFTAIHNGRIRPVPPPEPGSPPARLARGLVHVSQRLGLGRAAVQPDRKGRS
ncbi:SgcJ/EcaC family oxidoreductase [Saccharopolyspora sp. NPDC002376]